MSLNKRQCVGVIKELQKGLGLEDEDVTKLPRIVETLTRRAFTRPVIVSLAVDLEAQRIVSYALSSVVPSVQVYSILAKACLDLAGVLSGKASELKNVDKQERVAESPEQHRNDKPGNGGSAKESAKNGGGPGVAEEDNVGDSVSD